MSAKTPSRPIIGLTGGIGSGKSAAAQYFGALGAEIIDTDAIAHALTAPQGKALGPLRERFGNLMFDAHGNLDRAALRQHVFADPAERQALEGILHPMIRSEVADAIARTRRPYAMIVVPLLVETGAYRTLCRRIAVVDCSEATQIARTMRRSQLTEQQVRAIMAVQIDRATRLAAADDVIHNDGTLEELHAQVARLHQQYLTLVSDTSAGSKSR